MNPPPSSASTAPATRMHAEERRAQVLEAAMRAFGHGGYAGTSTDAVAKEAGVSQPYVVRMFGSKRELFLAVHEQAVQRIKAAFEAVLAEQPFDPADEDDWHRLGTAYVDLLADHDFLQVMLHGFAAGGGDPEIGARARAGMAEIYALVRSTGAPAEQVVGFIAQGMLLNVMVAMDAPAHLDDEPGLAELAGCAFGEDGLVRLCGPEQPSG